MSKKLYDENKKYNPHDLAYVNKDNIEYLEDVISDMDGSSNHDELERIELESKERDGVLETEFSGKIADLESDVATVASISTQQSKDIAENSGSIVNLTVSLNQEISNREQADEEINEKLSDLEIVGNDNSDDIDKNTSDILNNKVNIAENETDIGINASNIAQNTANIGSNTSNISNNSSLIATNTSNIQVNATKIENKIQVGDGEETGVLYLIP